MKYSVFKKLDSRRGAAMIIALLVFLLAVLSGTVALTMASSNAGRYTHEKDDQQAYLSVISAANLILSRLDGVTVVYKAPSGAPDPEEVTISYELGKENLSLKEDMFLKDDSSFKECLKAYSTGKVAEPFVFTLSSDETPQIGVVHVNVKILGGTFYFRLYYGEGVNQDYQMTLKVNTKFTSGVGNFQEEEGGFYRRMEFDTEGAVYTVEEAYKGVTNDEEDH